MDEKNLYLESLKVRNYEMYKYFKRGIEIISILKEKTYEAYIVGGAVRDFLLNIDFNDIDIATNATPSTIKEIFSEFDLDDTYENLGSIVIKEAGFRYEITTFRNEEYVKYKIKDVHYSQKLVEDIIRRDYTINALALTPNLTIVDLVDGQKDLENGVVRIIGSAKRRFKDDPTRIFRGLLLVAKYNFHVELNTEKGMRKGRNDLKMLGDNKIIPIMIKILQEKYGLKALKIIDDNNLFKFLPNYSYWVRLIIKNYKKLSLIEKMTLLYRIMGNIPDNTGHNHNELEEINKLLELSKHITVNKVSPIMVYKIGVEDLLKADRIAKVYSRKYKKQKREINKINRHLPIHCAKELDFTNLELIDLVKNDEQKIARIMNELIAKVVNKEVPNRNFQLKNEVLKMISKANATKDDNILRHKKENDEDFDDAKKETELYQKVYENYDEDPSADFDAWDQIPVDVDYYEQMANPNDNKQKEISDVALNALKEDYREDFMHLYQIYLKGVKDYYSLPEREQRVRSEELKQQVKEFLLRNNEKYRILHEKGLI